MYQIGACCIYVVFISTNVKELTDYAFSTNTDIRLFMVMLLLPLILINWVCLKRHVKHIALVKTYLFQIRNLKYLAPLSTIGNCFTVVSFAIICYYIFREPISTEGRTAFGPITELPMFFGTVLFALEAIGVIMPLENEMRKPQRFVGTTGILNRAMALIVSLYIGLGLCGYLKYGNETRSSITLNLPGQEM